MVTSPLIDVGAEKAVEEENSKDNTQLVVFDPKSKQFDHISVPTFNPRCITLPTFKVKPSTPYSLFKRNSGHAFIFITNLVIETAKTLTKSGRKFTFDTRCWESQRKAYCEKSGKFCYCPFEICGRAFATLWSELYIELRHRFTEAFNNKAIDTYALTFVIGHPNPFEKVLNDLGYPLKYIYDFLEEVNFEISVDKNLIRCDLRSIGFAQHYNITVLHKKSEWAKSFQEMHDGRL